MTKKVYTVEDITIMLDYGKSKVYEMLRENIIPNIRAGRKYIIPIKKFDEWLENSVEVR